MGQPVPSFRLVSEGRCDQCGSDEGPHYAYCGRVLCGACDLKRIDADVRRFGRWLVVIFAAFTVTVFVAILVCV